MSQSPSILRALNGISIRAKLILLNAVLIIGVICYGFFEQYSLNNLHELELASVENTAAEVDLLTLRRHEKDFLARHELKYQERFEQTFSKLSTRLTDLDQRIHDHGLQFDTRMSIIVSTLDNYHEKFTQLVTQIEKIDSQSNSNALLPQLFEARETLRENVVAMNNLQAKVAFSSLMENDFKYIGKPSEQTELGLSQSLQSFHQTYARHPSLSSAFDDYQHALVNLFEANIALGLTPNEGLRGELRRTVHQTEQEILSLQTEIESAIVQASDNVKNQLHIFGAIIAAVVSGLLILIGRSVLNRIRDINFMMRDIASGNGDLTARMNAEGNDELAQLANSFDSFISKLHGLIKDVANVKNVLNQSSLESEQAASNSINNAEQQKAESESVATAVNELVQTSNEITSNIEHAASNASRMKEESHRALEITHNASGSMQNLANDIANSQSLIEQLEEQSREINSVISTIQGIAEQTNLLALNAAIEAARAGEYGRGFAVVADEVRDLSMKTDNSTRQIESTISNLTDRIHSTVRIMSDSQLQAESTKQDTLLVVDAIDSVNQQIEDLFNMNAQIATASEEQSMVSAEIDRNITQIANLANDTHREVQGSVTCSKQVSEVSLKLDAIVAQFRY
ncbi:Putative methyl-accepting chemotaxis protein YoaH [Vibrio scophthalmi]|uniref:methyl-accepting chemotaxis protein n=1 Tax=Vibrio scophthalmi TaxID=45658 RepID=UPI0008098E25|nr:methyl-accepting chemotaxis protein [Vibrio scophthalmi]ANS85480.1 Putative methyl-accepting chemotaxis protein YoaH [Vibrio scophthalmi]